MLYSYLKKIYYVSDFLDLLQNLFLNTFEYFRLNYNVNLKDNKKKYVFIYSNFSVSYNIFL